MNRILLGFFLALTLLLCGCTPGKILEQVTGSNDDGGGTSHSQGGITQVAADPTPQAERTYMDEYKGRLVSFDGSTLSVQNQEGEILDFDVSGASLECNRGILGNDEVSIIYEGKPEEGDYTSLKILKVLDDLHKREPLKEYVIKGTLMQLTSWSATIRTAAGETLTLPCIGRTQYFSQGLILDMPIYVHCIGELPAQGDSSHPPILVKTISDQDPMKGPGTPAPTQPPEVTDPYTQVQTLNLVLEGIEGSLLKYKVPGMETILSLDLNGIPTFLTGGALPGTKAKAYYTGTFNGMDMNGIQVVEIRAQKVPEESRSGGMLVSGTVVGSTADTMTLICKDGTYFTFRTRDLAIPSKEIGDEATATLTSRGGMGSTIYHIQKLE